MFECENVVQLGAIFFACQFDPFFHWQPLQEKKELLWHPKVPFFLELLFRISIPIADFCSFNYRDPGGNFKLYVSLEQS